MILHEHRAISCALLIVTPGCLGPGSLSTCSRKRSCDFNRAIFFSVAFGASVTEHVRLSAGAARLLATCFAAPGPEFSQHDHRNSRAISVAPCQRFRLQASVLQSRKSLIMFTANSRAISTFRCFSLEVPRHGKQPRDFCTSSSELQSRKSLIMFNANIPGRKSRKNNIFVFDASVFKSVDIGKQPRDFCASSSVLQSRKSLNMLSGRADFC